EQAWPRLAEGAPAAVVGPEGAELGRHPADSDPEHEPATGELLHGRDPLRDEEGRTIRQDEDRRPEPDARRRRGEEGERGEWIQVAAVGALGIVGRDREVVGHPYVGDRRGRIREPRRGGDRLAGRGGTHVAEDDAESHRNSSVLLWRVGVNGGVRGDREPADGSGRHSPQSPPGNVLGGLAEPTPGCTT